MKQRTNVYLESEDTAILKTFAQREETTVAALVREGIELIIADRLNNPRTDRATARERLRLFIDRHAGAGPERSADEIKAMVVGKRRKRAKASTG